MLRGRGWVVWIHLGPGDILAHGDGPASVRAVVIGITLRNIVEFWLYREAVEEARHSVLL